MTLMEFLKTKMVLLRIPENTEKLWLKQKLGTIDLTASLIMTSCAAIGSRPLPFIWKTHPIHLALQRVPAHRYFSKAEHDRGRKALEESLADGVS